MNWFDTSGLTSLAKTALKEAQKTIDKALDIQDDSSEEQEATPTADSSVKSTPSSSSTPQKTRIDTGQDAPDFLASWGLTVSAESQTDAAITQHVVTESPSKGGPTMWGSFAGSFFEQPKSEDDSAIICPPKAKSMNVISDGNFSSQEDLFPKSQLVLSDGADSLEVKKSKLEELGFKIEERRSSSRSAGLSLISSRNSSDSVEVLSQSLKSTPDSEAASIHSISHSSSSVGQKLNSESVEILPDSLVSPSSIECLGFDSYSSDKNSSSSSNLSPECDASDKKSTPVNEKAGETADSVSLVADDDEDTMSYNSVSECTAPTVFDNEDKSVSPFPKPVRAEPQKKIEKDLVYLDQPVPMRMQLSENSSNDGSWSDRTLNADNDSLVLDPNAEEPKKEVETEDTMIEKLSDSSSFYNVNVSSEMLRSDSSAFINVEKQQCKSTDSNESTQKECSVKERTSPNSLDSKSDLVKIGSDRTSGHTSGDDIETTTSSDIEIIPSPNGDNINSLYRNSPTKYGFKQSKFDGSTSPNLVDLVLGKSLASKIRGHNRELSEASVQSAASDDSQGSENERLMRRLCEMTEILEAREGRLMEVSRNNAELAESNADLKSQVEMLMGKHEGGDISTITEDYTQRMSALEKKFQQAIREKDQLRKQLDSLKSETSTRKISSELEYSLKEKDDMISQLQEEGEKLSRQQLQHSNIIKKLRAKEKDNEQVIKGLRDKIADQTAELDRLKRSIAAKEELEVNQIEAVYRLTTANKKMETELMETKSLLDDTTQRFDSTRTSLEAARRELSEAHRGARDAQRDREAREQQHREREACEREGERLRAQLQQCRTEMVQEEKRWIARCSTLSSELQAARAAGAGAEAAGAGAGEGAAALLAQLASLQRSATERERAHAQLVRNVARQLAEAQTSLAKANEQERLTREENLALQAQATELESLLRDAESRSREVKSCEECLEKMKSIVEMQGKLRSLEELRDELTTHLSGTKRQMSEMETQLAAERGAVDVEKKRNTILQEQLANRGDISPPHSVMSDSLSASLFAGDDNSEGLPPPAYHPSFCAAEAAAAAARADQGSRRDLLAQCSRLQTERTQLRDEMAALRASLNDCQSVREQYDALLLMYGEKEEQLAEVRLDLEDVKQLYKAQLDELIALKQQVKR